jgi:hypothetical protein
MNDEASGRLKTATDCFFNEPVECGGMPSEKAQLAVLKRLISDADHSPVTTPELPGNRTAATREILTSALALTDNLLKHARMPAAARLGHRGGSTTSRLHGPEHYRKMAAKRKTCGGGRRGKDAE